MRENQQVSQCRNLLRADRQLLYRYFPERSLEQQMELAARPGARGPVAVPRCHLPWAIEGPGELKSESANRLVKSVLPCIAEPPHRLYKAESDSQYRVP